MTKNTTFYRIKNKDKEIIYKDLSVLDLSYLENIKSDVMRNELAAKASIVSPTNLEEIPWPILQQIGRNVIENSVKYISDKQLFEILVKEYRDSLTEGGSPLSMIRYIMLAFPGQSVTELLKLTWKDLVELVCLSEEVLGKKIFNVGGSAPTPKKGSRLANFKYFDEDGKSLQDKMSELNNILGGTPKK